MKRLHVSAAALAALSMWAMTAHGASILVDFGTVDHLTESPTNGVYWNNAADAAGGAVLQGLVTTSGALVPITISNQATFIQNGGVAVGGLTNPSPAQLGNLAVDTATIDFWAVASNVTSGIRFDLSGLNPTATYSFRFFGTRATALTRVTEYTVSGASTQAVLLTTSGTDSGGPGYDGNVSNVAVVVGISPDADGRIGILLKAQTGDFGYLSGLEIEVVERTPLQTVLVDFGTDSLFRSISVTNPDQNGNTWNSIGSFQADLLNTGNNATPIDIGFTSSFGPDSYNGPAGETSDPLQPSEIAATSIDTVSLGSLGVTHAAIDFFAGVDQTFTISDLDPTKIYSLTFFGAHKFSANSATIYSVYSDSAYTGLVASTTLDVQVPASPWIHNSNKVATIYNLTPQAGNSLYVMFTGDAGGDGYINALRIEVYDNAATDITGIKLAAGSIDVSFIGSNTVSYALQYTTDPLNGAGWADVLNGATPMSGIGDGVSTVTLTDTNHADRSRVYRLVPSP